MIKAGDLRSEAEALRNMLADVCTDAVRREVMALIDELEALAREMNNGDAE
jgi:hypothetical protein